MPTKQGSLDLLNDPVAQQLLNSNVIAHLAYVWSDGTPRIIPIGFTWNGKELVTATFDIFPKAKVLKEGTQVAVTFDTYTFPWKVLSIRGIVHLSEYDGIVPEWQQAGERVMGKEGAQGFSNMVEGMMAKGVFKTLRLSVEPTWVGIIDFEQRFPSAIEKGMEAMASAG